MTREEKKLNTERKEALRELLKILGTQNICIVEVHGDFTQDQIDQFIDQCINDCIAKGLLDVSNV